MRKTFVHAIWLIAAAGCGSAANDPASGTTAPGLAPTATAAAGSGAQAAPAMNAGATSTPASTTGGPGTPTTTTGAGAAMNTMAAMPANMGAAAAPGTVVNPAAAGGAPGAMMPGAAPGELPKATGAAITEACRGFDFTGLVHSPGGDVTPNKCEAFHPTLNNPYAVRCIDVWPWYKTKFPGDNYCILPPPPDKGIQIGHHPQGQGDAWFKAVSTGDMSGYENTAADWRLAPGGEEERNITISHTNKAGNYYRIFSRMRGGSHHMIPSTTATPGTGTWGPGSPDGLFTGTGYPGAQRPDENTPQSPVIPSEDDGLYRQFPANATVVYNMHHFNSTDKDILKEVWQNLWWTDNAKTLISQLTGLPATQVAGVFANPGEIVDMHYASTVPGNVRVLDLFGHRHAWTTVFTAWKESGGKEEIVYQSFNWFDEPTYTYNSEAKNPPPAHEKRSDGGHNGVLMLSAGDKLHFNCHIEYTDERAMSENSPVKPASNGPLRFSNQAFNAEMCILFGSSVGDVGLLEQLGPPPDFAVTR